VLQKAFFQNSKNSLLHAFIFAKLAVSQTEHLQNYKVSYANEIKIDF